MDSEITTATVIELLGDDCERCHGELVASIDAGKVADDGSVDADYGYHARRLVRAIFAYIEATTFSVKAAAAWKCIEEDIEITPFERYFATDTEHELNDRGEVVEAVAKISLARNIRFALNLNRKARYATEPFDPTVEWWSCLKEAIKIRDRLTHPKWPSDLAISGAEIVKVLKAKNGFEEELLRFDMSRIVFLGNIVDGCGKHVELHVPGREQIPQASLDWPVLLHKGSLNVRISPDGYPNIFEARSLSKSVRTLDEKIFRPAFEISQSELGNNKLIPTSDMPHKGSAQVWRAKLTLRDREIPCWALRRYGSGVDEQLELISELHLRSTYSLVTGDAVVVTLESGDRDRADLIKKKAAR